VINGDTSLPGEEPRAGGEQERPPTLCLVRHAKAYSRRRWVGDDHDRPLADQGHEQASLLTEHILGHVGRPSRILSSPALRCRETMAPLAAECGLDVTETAWLDEGSAPGDAFDRVSQLTLKLDAGPGGGPVAACTHGDVMWGILESLAAGGAELGETLQAPKGAVWILAIRPDAPPLGSLFVPKVCS
jgi:broad specificity phosphatase PhoE